MTPTQIGPYRIIRLLGEGGMGTVYEAIQQPIQRRVALKVLLPQYVQNRDVLNRFFNEARAVNLIEHPSIVQVSDYGQAPDGTTYLVMEYLRGETLSSRLSRLCHAGERLQVVEALQFGAQIADALSAAHEKSIVHRDLKPANIMLVRDSAVHGSERAKILDFGIAKLIQEPAAGTAINAVMGTPQYMSPEQCRGAGGVDEKTDVYALGVMLYEMLAGRPPFLAESGAEYMGQHIFEDPPPLRDIVRAVPADVATLVHRLLNKDKAARPPMHELSAALVRLLSPRAVATSTATALTQIDTDVTLPTQHVTPSTLGGAQGQERPVAKRSARSLLVRALVAAGCLLITAAVFRPWSWPQLRPHSATSTTPASSTVTAPLAVPPASPSLGTLPVPVAELPPAGDMLEPSPAPLVEPQVVDADLAKAARSPRPPTGLVAPARIPKSTSDPGLKKRSHRQRQPPPTPPPAEPDSSTKRTEDYEL